MRCPHCGQDIPDAVLRDWLNSRIAGSKSEKKAASSRENGKKGGRPRKEVGVTR